MNNKQLYINYLKKVTRIHKDNVKDLALDCIRYNIEAPCLSCGGDKVLVLHDLGHLIKIYGD